MAIDIQKYRHRALGIDPGLAATGFAIIGTFKQGGELCAYGALKTISGQSTPQRLQKIYLGVCDLMDAWQPGVIALEDVYVLDKFPNAAVQLGEVRGVLYLAAQQRGIEVFTIRPTEVKSCLTGNGRASKEQVSQAVKRLLGRREDIKPDHASDAAALALMIVSRKGYFNW
ncbi:MAG: crossover junction endodeoxyribonuclease RuvC [Deltaproteobacteria bacterium]|nr:crossover junction endodeoxyribonuclease RuvC [Deltaproteobacteria bacterium]